MADYYLEFSENVSGLSEPEADWLADQIRDPKAHDPQTVMPAFKALSTEQVGDLVENPLNVTIVNGHSTSIHFTRLLWQADRYCSSGTAKRLSIRWRWHGPLL